MDTNFLLAFCFTERMFEEDFRYQVLVVLILVKTNRSMKKLLLPMISEKWNNRNALILTVGSTLQ